MSRHPKHEPTTKEQRWFEKLIRLRRHYESTLPRLEKDRAAADKATREFNRTQIWSNEANLELRLHQSADPQDA